MRKADKIKLSVMVGVSLLAFVVGCVDTAVQPLPTSIDYTSEVSVVNLTAGTGTATISVYNAKVNADSLTNNLLLTEIDYSKAAISANVDLGSTLPDNGYQELPAGGKAIVVSYTNSAYKDTFKLTTDSQYKMRIFIVGDTAAGTRTAIKSAERYTWQTPSSTDGAQLFPADSGWLRVFNGSPDGSGAVSVDVRDAVKDSSYDAADVNFKSVSSYFKLPSGNNFNLIVTAGSTVDTVAFTPASQKRYTAVVYNYAASLLVKILTDD